MVSHNEVSAVRHLIWKLDVAVTQGFLCQIGLIQRLAVYGDISLLIYIYPASGTCDHSLYQYLVIVVKGDHISLDEIGSFYGNYDLSLLDSGVHGTAVDLKYREQEYGDQNCRCCHGDQGSKGVSQYPVVSVSVFCSV